MVGFGQRLWRVIPLAALLALAACLPAIVGMRAVRSYQAVRDAHRTPPGASPRAIP